MAVGTIASLKVSNLTSTSFDVTFAKPANVTKIKWEIIPIDGVYNGFEIVGTRTLTRPCTGTTGASLVEHFSTLNPSQQYYLYATPYNGSEVGTRKSYTSSNALPPNTIRMGYSVPATSTAPVYDPVSKIIYQGALGGAVLNDAVSNVSASSAPNVPVPGTTEPAPNDLSSRSRVTLDVTELETKHTYAIFVRSKATTTDGKTITSPWSLPIHVNTPEYSASGNNFATKNSNGDIQLSGGSLYAGTFPINAGQINVVTDTPNATGVVLNQTGIAGFNAGAKQFYISASTGDAWFAGKITGNAYINDVLASTVVSNAYNGNALVATALKMVGSQISNATGQIQLISSNGTTFYSGSSPTAGARLLVNQYGILGHNSLSTADLDHISFAITSSSFTGTDAAGNTITLPAGSAYFSGTVAASTITGGTITGSTIKTTAGSYGITITSSGGASDSIKLVNTVGTAEIKLATDANGLHIVPIGGTGGADGLTLYGSGSAGVPNTIIAREPLLIKQDDPDLVNNTTGSLWSARNIKIAHYAASGTPGTGGPYYNGDIFLQYTP